MAVGKHFDSQGHGHWGCDRGARMDNHSGRPPVFWRRRHASKKKERKEKEHRFPPGNKTNGTNGHSDPEESTSEGRGRWQPRTPEELRAVAPSSQRTIPEAQRPRDTECVGLLKAQFVTKSDLNLPKAVYSLHLCNVTIPAITRTKSPCVCAAGAATRGATHGTVCSLEIMWKSLERETPSAPELKGWPWVRARCGYSTLPGSLRHAPGPAGKR